MRRALIPLLAAAFALPAQDALPPEVLMLARIRDRVRQAVERLPDCTCIESVARFRSVRGKGLQPTDKLVFQVLFTGDRELFSLPGGSRWEKDPFPFMSSGMMANGIFALHLRVIFLNDQSLIRYHGMESPGVRQEARYDLHFTHDERVPSPERERFGSGRAAGIVLGRPGDVRCPPARVPCRGHSAGAAVP